MANTGNDYEIINASEFDVAKDILYTKPKVNPQGGKSIGILNSNSKKGLYISTPLMLTWGINENDFEGKGNVKYDMALQFDPDKSPSQAAFLKASPSFRLVIEGHCDERGTREYNLALGDRRASAVRDYLVAKGINASRLSTISYGKERPSVGGSNDTSYALNRRSVSRIDS